MRNEAQIIPDNNADKHVLDAATAGRLDTVKSYNENHGLDIFILHEATRNAVMHGRYQVTKYLIDILLQYQNYIHFALYNQFIPLAMQEGHLNILRYLKSKTTPEGTFAKTIQIDRKHYHVLRYFRNYIEGAILANPIAIAKYQDTEARLLKKANSLVHEVSLKDVSIYHALSYNIQGLMMLKRSLKKDAPPDTINTLPQDIQNLILMKFNEQYDASCIDFFLAQTLHFPTEKEIDAVKSDCSLMARIWIALLQKNQIETAEKRC